jgi:hypothetical protein
MTFRPGILGLFAAATLATLPPATHASEKAKPVARYTAFAVDMSGRTRGAGTGTVDIVIERWSTPDEIKRLGDSLKEGGTDSLLKQLRKVEPRVGYISTAGSLAYPLRFAIQDSLASGGSRLLVGTDRRLGFFVLQGSRTVDYPFLVIEVRFGADGKGQGKLLPLARVEYDPDDVVRIENYDAEPVRLTSVRPDN